MNVLLAGRWAQEAVIPCAITNATSGTSVRLLMYGHCILYPMMASVVRTRGTVQFWDYAWRTELSGPRVELRGMGMPYLFGGIHQQGDPPLWPPTQRQSKHGQGPFLSALAAV